jgi:hypothetical protein
MRPAALLPILAIGAALLGAPSPASAAGNTLTGAAATPTSVAPGALVRLSVRYDGRFAATSVSAEVGALTVPLVRQTGTATSGTWARAVTLPVGRWTVIFRATTAQGSAPSLTGPTVTVGLVVAPTAAPDDHGGSGPESSTALPLASDTGAPAQPAAPAAPAPSAALPSSSAGGGSSDDEPTPALPSDISPERADDAADRAPVGAPARAAAAPPPTAAGRSPEPRAEASGGSTMGAPVDPSPAVGADLPEDASGGGGVSIGMALIGVAAIAIVGAGLIAAGRERRKREAPPPVSAEVAAAVLDKRALRQGKVRLEPDPIVAALGIEDAAARRAKRRRRPARVDEQDRPEPKG